MRFSLFQGRRSVRPERFLLEDQLQTELNHPRPAVAQPGITLLSVRRLGDRAEAGGDGDPIYPTVTHVYGRQSQVGVIEKVEGFRAELSREAIV